MIEAKKSLGQNFLIDKNIIKKIIKIANINSNEHLVEIGSGTGSLSKELIKLNPKSLMLVEKDENLHKLLKDELHDNSKISFINQDILKFNIEEKIKKNTIILGNLPYNISSQILIKMIKFKKWPPKYKKLVFMFQKEVAQKLISDLNKKNFGRITIISNWRLKVKDYFKVSNKCFFPVPKVDSMIVVFEPTYHDSIKIKNIENLEKITQVFFSNKRKMINKGFKRLFKDENLANKTLKLNLSKRPSELSIFDYFKITEYFEKKKLDQ